MKPKADVIDVLGKHRIYLEHYHKDEHAKTVILVNGAFATTASFAQTVRYLKDDVNVVLFDLPYAGRSQEHNSSGKILTKEDEVEILDFLISRYNVNYLMSVSWGGVSSLLSLSHRPASIEKAIIASFSPVINPAMHDYMVGARGFLQVGDISGAAQLLNNTVGRHLSGLVKSHNYNYLLSNVEGNEEQIIFHINQIFEFDRQQYMQKFASINVPVLFLNGELDEYTTSKDVQLLSDHISKSEFTVVENAGHFLDLESRQLWRKVSSIIREYLLEAKQEESVYKKPVYSVSGFAEVLGQSLSYAEAGD